LAEVQAKENGLFFFQLSVFLTVQIATLHLQLYNTFITHVPRKIMPYGFKMQGTMAAFLAASNEVCP
jgi:hypothetical protein